MNLQRSDEELRFEAQQIEIARLEAERGPVNPFAAAFGVAVIVAAIALVSAIGSIVEILVRWVRAAANDARALFHWVHSALGFGDEGTEPYADFLIWLLVATTCVFAWRVLIEARTALGGPAHRPRT